MRPMLVQTRSRAYARATGAGQRRANDLPRGTGVEASGTAAAYLAALPVDLFGAQPTTEGIDMQFKTGAWL